MEFEPRYVDVAIRRWQILTKLEATLEGDGRTFDEIAKAREHPEHQIIRPNQIVGKPRPKLTPGRAKAINSRGRRKTRTTANSERGDA